MTNRETPPQAPPFRAGVEVVELDVSVTRGGKPVTGLTARDFALTDNGVAQEVQSVTLDRLPLSVTLVLDTSRSVSGDRLARLTQAGGRTDGRPRPERPRVAHHVLAQGESAGPMTGDLQSIRSAPGIPRWRRRHGAARRRPPGDPVAGPRRNAAAAARLHRWSRHRELAHRAGRPRLRPASRRRHPRRPRRVGRVPGLARRDRGRPHVVGHVGPPATGAVRPRARRDALPLHGDLHAARGRWAGVARTQGEADARTRDITARPGTSWPARSLRAKALRHIVC